MAPSSVVIEELWVWPIKACRGVSVPSSELTHTGLEYDRMWCLVDPEGVNVSVNQAISQRLIPAMGTVTVNFSDDRRHLVLDAPGMPQITIPTSIVSYASMESLKAECSGKSTTTGLGWSLGFIESKVHAAASEWFTEYLNTEVTPGKYRSGFQKKTRYVLVRSMHGLDMESYSEEFPLIERAKEEGSDYHARFANNSKRFQDFAPLHLISRESCQYVGDLCMPDGEPYPYLAFRANIVVEGCSKAWAEETWGQLQVVPQDPKDKGVLLRKIKEVPRCSVPCRKPGAGGPWIFPGQSLKLWKVLKKVFPRKYSDEEWGVWAGPFFGVYFGHANQDGSLRVGDRLEVVQTVRWDAHLSQFPSYCFALSLGGATLAVATVALASWQRSRSVR